MLFDTPHRLEKHRPGLSYTCNDARNQLEILADVESAGGAGLGNAFGIAGFTNLDVVRNATLSEDPCVVRVMLHIPCR
jgi:hypothetical protein